MSGSPIMTYTSLVASIENYLERGDTANSDPSFDAELPNMIMLAQKQVLQDLRILGFKEVVTGTMVQGTYVYANPDRWRETISLTFTAADDTGTLNQRTPLNQRDYTYLQLLEPDRSVEAPPKYYAQYDASNIIVSPTPDDDYPFEWSYYAIPPLLSDDQQTNWLTDYLPNLLLFQCLLQCSPFLKNDERLAVWKGMYDERVQKLVVEDVRKIGDGTAIRRGA